MILNSIRIFDATGKSILFSESEKPETIEIVLGAEAIEISREDWRELTRRIPDYYSSGAHFKWALPPTPAVVEEPEQPPDPEPLTLDPF
jgi:hypothetical protein